MMEEEQRLMEKTDDVEIIVPEPEEEDATEYVELEPIEEDESEEEVTEVVEEDEQNDGGDVQDDEEPVSVEPNKDEEDVIEEVEEQPVEEEEPKKKRFFSKSSKNNKETAKKVRRTSFSERRKEKKEKKEKEKQKKKDNADPDSFGERLRRWKLIHKEGYVILRTLSRDSTTGEYLRETTLVKKDELPRDAVAVTNMKGIYCYDTIRRSEWYVKTHYDPFIDPRAAQFTASDAALYMTSNKIDNALAIKWTEFSHVDFKKYIPFILIGLFIVLFLIMRG